MKELILFLVMGLSIQTVVAQQQVMFTQYMFNQLALNPAYAGVHGGISSSFLARHQWVGFEGAPRTQTFSIHSPIKFKRIALGAVVIGDRLGITDQFGAHFSGAYRIELSETSKLSFGLQGSYNQYRADFTRMDGNDPMLAGQNINDRSINFGTGILWHGLRHYVGFSIPQLINNDISGGIEVIADPDSGGSADPDTKQVRHYFLTAGYIFRLNQNVQLKPNILFKYVDGAPIQLDVNANFLFLDLVWVGMSYRALESVDALLQIQVSPQFQIGYAYDFVANSGIGRVNSGSHELMINYVFKIHSDKVVSPRYF